MWSVHTMEYYSTEKEWSTDAWFNADVLWKQCTKWCSKIQRICHMILFLEYSEEAKIDLWLQGLPGGRNWESPVMTLGLLLGMIVVSI